MQNADWITLFRQLPKALHSQLVLVAQNRTDISVETIFRLEPNYMVVRGRQGGTTDSGYLFMFPYDQISSVFINREVKEEEIETLFQNVAPVARLAAGSHQGENGTSKFDGTSVAQRPTGAAATPTPSPATPVAATTPTSTDPSSVARNNLLERLRAARNAALPHKGK